VPARAQNLSIYTDSLQNGWQNWSWATTNFSNTTPAHSGSDSIAVTPGAWAAIYLHASTSINTSTYASLSFWIHGGSAGGQQLQVAASLGGTMQTSYSLNPLTTGWQQIVIPLSALGVANAANMDGFWIQDRSGTSQPTFYVDDVSLISVSVSNVTVTGDLNQSRATVPPLGYGVHTSVYDNNFTPTDLPSKLKAAGVTALRYPGGSYADAFHWQTMSASTGVGEYINSNDTFDNLVTKDAQPSGAGVIITCNYGSNAAGNGGADPNEAAAWVDYSNNTKHYGVKYWEIGNEIPGNGFYGADWEVDQHYPSSTNRVGQPALGPTAYGQNVLQFVSAMKAKDPTIKVGVVMCTPGSWPDGVSPDWNTNMLAQCGTQIDFVIIHWYPGGNAASSLASSSTIAGVVSKVRSLINTYCGTNASNVEILVTETGAGGDAGDGIQQTLFTSDNYLTWFENGAKNVDYLELHSYFLSEGVSGLPDDSPGEGYYGALLASNVARAGDTLCSASSNNSLVGVHIANRTDGSIGIQLINKDPSNTATVTVNLTNGTFASSGTRNDFGKANFPATGAWPSSGMSTSTITGIGPTSFTVTVPAYTASNFIIPKGTVAAPTFTATATASPSTVVRGATSAITASFTDTGVAASNLVTDIEVFDSTGAKVGQQTYSGQNFTAGGTNTYNWSWTAPTTTGAYTVSLGVFSSDWSTNYYWGSNAATITVTDVTPPTTSVSLSGTLGSNGWYSASPVTATLSATDPDGSADVAATYYTVDGGGQQTYTAPFAVSGDGTHTISFWSVDKAGNIETAQSQQVEIDAIGPSTAESASITSAIATVTLSATDNASGVASTFYTVDGGAAQTYSAPFIISTGGSHAISYWSVDVAGNVEVANTASVVVPVQLASVTVAPQAVTGGASATVTVTLNGPAPSTGTVVTLTSSNSAATFTTGSVKVPAGSTSAIATVHTVPVSISPLVTITAKAGVSHTCHLRINVPAVSSIHLSPSAVAGGTSSTGTVTLTGATAADTTITVTSSASDAVIGAPVVVPAGASSTSFTITTTPVVTSTASTITASSGGGSASTTLTIKPPYLSSVSFSPHTVTGGQSGKLIVTLASPAATGGAVISLTYPTNGALLVGAPSTVNIPAGGTTATVTFGTTAVASNSTVTVSATINGSTKGNTLTLTP